MNCNESWNSFFISIIKLIQNNCEMILKITKVRLGNAWLQEDSWRVEVKVGTEPPATNLAP